MLGRVRDPAGLGKRQGFRPVHECVADSYVEALVKIP